MAGALKLDVYTPRKTAVESEASAVTLPGFHGEFTVLPGHAAFVAKLCPGRMVFQGESGNGEYVIGSGFAEIRGDVLVVLTSSAETRDQLNAESIRRSLENGRKQLAGLSLDDPGYADASDAVTLDEARLQLLGASA